MESKFSGGGNSWYTGFIEPENSITPFWDANPIVTDPLLSIEGSKLIMDVDSPLIGKSEGNLLRDIYGQLRNSPSSIGAVEFIKK